MKTKFTRHLGVKCSLALLLTLFFSSSFAQTTYTWKGGTGSSGTPLDYQVSTNWSPTRTTPATNDILVFDLGNVNGSSSGGSIFVTNIKSETIGQLKVNQSGGTPSARTLTFAGTPVTLTVTGNLTIQQSCTLADGGYTISVGGDIAFQTNTGANTTVSATLHSGTGKIQVTGSSSRFYNGNGTTQTTANFTFGNIEIYGSSASLSMTATYNAIQINGTLTINQGKFNMSNATSNRTFVLNSISASTPTGLINCINGGVVVGGSNAGFSITGSGPLSGNSSIGTINFDNTSLATSTLNNISITRPNSTLTIGTVNAAGLTISGSIALNAGTLDDGGNTINVGGGNLFTTLNYTPGAAIYKSTGSGKVKYTRANATAPIFFNLGTSPTAKCYLEVGNILWAPSSSSTASPVFNSTLATKQISVTLDGSFNYTRNASQTPTITINSTVDTFYVAPTGSINIPTGLTFDFGSKPVILQSSAAGTASIAAISGTLNNATNVTLQQWVTGQRGYRILSNPFSTSLTPSTIGTANGITITGASDVKLYNGITNAWSGSVSSIPANTPYTVFVRGLTSEVTGLVYTAGPSAFAYGVTGTLNTATTAISQNNTTANDWTIAGNPFAAPVNSSALTGGVVGTPYYVYSMAQNNTGTQVKAGGWVAAGSNSSTTTPIPLMGVVAYQAGTSAPSSFNVASTDINTANTAQTGLFGTGDVTTQLELQLSNGVHYQDKLFVRQDANASDLGNERMDLPKLSNDVTNIYTITSDKAHLAVDARKGIEASIPLGITAPVGNYTFTVASNNLPNASNVYLLDKLLNTQTILQAGATYSFAITADNASQGEGRFELGAIKLAIPEVVVNDAFSVKVLGNVVNNSATLQVKGAKGAVQITVSDIQGKIISTTTSSNVINTLNLSSGSGMYFIKVTDGDTNIVTKVVKP